MAIGVNKLGEREVKSGYRFWSGFHRDTEACFPRLPAIDRNKKCVLAAHRVRCIRIRSLREHAVLDGNCVQLASTHADEGKFGRRAGSALHSYAVLVFAHCPQSLDGPVEKAFPGLRPHRKSEQRVIVAPIELIASWRLTVGPAGRQISEACDSVIDDRAVSYRRSDYFMVFRERVEQRLQRVTRDDSRVTRRDGNSHFISLSVPISTND